MLLDECGPLLEEAFREELARRATRPWVGRVIQSKSGGAPFVLFECGPFQHAVFVYTPEWRIDGCDASAEARAVLVQEKFSFADEDFDELNRWWL